MKYYAENRIHRKERLKQGKASLKAYTIGITYFTSICTDVILTNNESKTIYLAKRRIFPSKGWWVIGGRKMPFEILTESMQRNIREEIGLKIPSTRLINIGEPREFFWKERRQMPRHLGRDDICFWFSLELDDIELAKAAKSLDTDEYEKEGLKNFTRDELVREKVHSSIIEAYDEIFS